MSRGPARLAETAAVGVALALLAGVVLGGNVLEGGFAWDDWENAATTAYPPATGFIGPLDLGTFAFRPLLAVALAGTHAVLGPIPGLHLGLALVLAVAMSVALFAVLRELGLGRAPAAAVAALVLVFPWSDSTRLWATAGLNNLAVVLWLLGVSVMLRGAEARGRRALRLHATAAGLYLASVLLYQATAVVILASLALYARGERRSRTRGRVPARCPLALATGGTLLLAAAIGVGTADAASSPARVLDHAAAIASQSLALVGRSLAPFADLPEPLVGACVLAVVALVGLWAWRPSAGRATGPRTDLRRSSALAAAGIAVLGCAYAVFVPADDRYVPFAEGTANRVNLVAALGYALLAVGAAWALATLVAVAAGRVGASAERGRVIAAALWFALTGAVGTAWALELRSDARAWERAAVLRAQVLAAIERRAGELGPGSTVLTVGHPADVATGIPVFATSWDLNGAIKITLRDGGVSARPLTRAEPLRCGRRALGPAPTYNSRPEPIRYGRTFLLDVRGRGALSVIDGPGACRSVAARLARGDLPLVATRAP